MKETLKKYDGKKNSTCGDCGSEEVKKWREEWKKNDGKKILLVGLVDQKK